MYSVCKARAHKIIINQTKTISQCRIYKSIHEKPDSKIFQPFHISGRTSDKITDSETQSEKY